jgi:hypothetical protein
MFAGVHATPAVHAVQVPLSQTSLVPHDAPFATLFPVSPHTGTPVEHEVDPVWHGLTGVQTAPVVHAAHAPLSQTWLVPHDVPLATWVLVALHTGVPVVHEVVPVRHGFVGVHAAPAVHVIQVPLLQTSLVPHEVPLEALLPESVQVCVEQLKVPVWQALVGVHAAPFVHVMQEPLSQTWPEPHEVPLGTLPFEVQTETPVEQEVIPVWHAAAGVHVVPAVQETQLPLSQTRFVPQDVPLPSWVVVALHTGTPVVHEVVPVTQGFVGVHAAPVVHAVHEPLSQTSFVPHEVPLLTLVPVSVHTETPVEQEVVPVWHGLAGVQFALLVHAVHVPLSQTWLVPHDVPLVTWVVVALQTGVPVVHEVVPVTHGFVGVHAAPVVHVIQLPLLQTSLVPHEVPLETLVPVSVQTDTPVVQEVVPVWHAFVGVHAAFAVHALHEPLSQTSLVPHEVPLLALFPVSVHTDTPVEQEVVPVWHGLAGVQVALLVHAPQVPLSQTSFVPHDVPLATLVPVSVHTGAPVEQEVVPVWHALVGVHDAPDEHAPQVPLSQNSPVPQEVPLVTFVPVSVHTGAPVVHDVVPVWHSLVGVHDAPVVHALHDPLSQTSFVPHEVPLETLVPVSVHTATPVVHEIVPVWQLLAGVHAVPDGHDPHVPLSQTSPLPHGVPLAT